MIDHILGRPNQSFRKYQVFTVLLLWSTYLYKGNKHGPPGIRRLSEATTKRMTAWQTVISTLLFLYFQQNFAKLFGLTSPEPFANMYTRDYFRASWVAVGLDAGFWTCMNLRPVWFRDIMSVIASIYYLFNAEKADVLVKKVLGCVNIDFMRVSWNKSQSPILSFASKLLWPRYMHRIRPRKIYIRRPQGSDYEKPVTAWLFFDGPIEHLKRHDKIVFDIPGGGFVAMSPKNHIERLLEWSGKTGLPVVSIDYHKAPEQPYPYALHECFDAYCEIVRSKGRCVGLAGDVDPKIVISGDSAGGNIAAGVTLMLAQRLLRSSRSRRPDQQRSAVPMPEGLVLTYPALDVNLSIWMTPEQVDLMRQKRVSNKGILERKDEDYRRLQPRSHSTLFLGSPESMTPAQADKTSPLQTQELAAKLPNEPFQIKRPFKTSLAMTSMISYFDDRILPAQLMRAMMLLYVGEQNQPDFATDYLLSPLLAPDELLAQFPKVYLLCGERDPLSDDTVLFAGRLRQAHEQRFLQRQAMDLEPRDKVFESKDHVEYQMIPGVSHGFTNFVNFYPAAWKYIAQLRHWITDLFDKADARTMEELRLAKLETLSTNDKVRRASENAIDDSGASSPLEMSMPNHSDGDLLHKEVDTAQSDTAQVYAAGRRSSTTPKRTLSRLTSSDNLIDRRMKGLTMNLLGDGVSAEPSSINSS